MGDIKNTKKTQKNKNKNKKILVSASHLLVTINCSSNFAIFCAKVISKTQKKTQKQKQKQKNPCVCLSPSRHHKLLKQLCDLLCKGDIKNTKKNTKTKTKTKSLC